MTLQSPSSWRQAKHLLLVFGLGITVSSLNAQAHRSKPDPYQRLQTASYSISCPGEVVMEAKKGYDFNTLGAGFGIWEWDDSDLTARRVVREQLERGGFHRKRRGEHSGFFYSVKLAVEIDPAVKRRQRGRPSLAELERHAQVVMTLSIFDEQRGRLPIWLCTCTGTKGTRVSSRSRGTILSDITAAFATFMQRHAGSPRVSATPSRDAAGTQYYVSLFFGEKSGGDHAFTSYNVASRLQSRGLGPLRPATTGRLLGPFPTRPKAQAVARRVSGLGIDNGWLHFYVTIKCGRNLAELRSCEER